MIYNSRLELWYFSTDVGKSKPWSQHRADHPFPHPLVDSRPCGPEGAWIWKLPHLVLAIPLEMLELLELPASLTLD